MALGARVIRQRHGMTYRYLLAVMALWLLAACGDKRMSDANDQVQLSGQIQLTDLDALKAAGIGTIINNRPDGEAPDQPSSAEVEAKATALGMRYFYVPVSPKGITEDNVTDMRAALAQAEGGVFAYCRTGNRSGIVLAAANSAQ